jgi:hypothetical protein
MFRAIMDYLGYVQAWIWIWGFASTSAVVVLVWALITRLPGVVIFVLALGTGVFTLIGIETGLIVYAKIKNLLGARYSRAVAALAALRAIGVVLRNREVQSDREVEAFVADVADFETRALGAMRGAATRTDIAWFQHLQEWTAPVFPGHNDEHALMRVLLDEKLRRMHTIAGRIEAKIR